MVGFLYNLSTDGKPCKNQFSTFEGLDERHAPGTLQNIFNTVKE